MHRAEVVEKGCLVFQRLWTRRHRSLLAENNRSTIEVHRGELFLRWNEVKAKRLPDVSLSVGFFTAHLVLQPSFNDGNDGYQV